MKINWQTKELGEVLEYEQPTLYIVSSKNYKEEYETPVLTAGKSFILGKTKEKSGIFPKDKLPVIIFDDFTTATQFVDFPFKVKSSAMKILHPVKKISDAKFLFYLIQTINFNYKGIHKRYWISEYSKIKILLPPLPEQHRIVKILDETFEKIEKIKENVKKNLKNTKELFESYLQSVFVNLGKDWGEKRLGDVCNTGAGGTPLKSHKDYYEDGNIPWIRSGEVCKKEIIKSELFITEKGLKNSSARLFPPNTVLVAMYGATAAQTGILKFQASTNQAVCGILPNNNFLPDFIYYFFSAIKSDLVKQAVGGAQPNISQIKIKDMFIPILPISEQKSIVVKLDKLSLEIKKLEEMYKQKLTDLEELKKSILKKAFNGEL